MTSSLPRRRSTTELQQRCPAKHTRYRRDNPAYGPADRTGIRHCKPTPRLVKRKNQPPQPAPAGIICRRPPGVPSRRLPEFRGVRQPPSLVYRPAAPAAGTARRVARGVARWCADLREDPGRLWRGPVPRLLGLVLLGLAAVLGLHWLIGGLAGRTLALPSEQVAPRATLYVACTNAGCWAAYTTQQPMDFKAWPMKCEKCGALTVYRATLCPTCRQWYAVAPGQPPACPHCAAKTAVPDSKPASIDPQKSRDDAEDPW